jgi:hypothetical protein
LVVAHRDQQFCGRIHRAYDTAGNITVQAGADGWVCADVAKALTASTALRGVGDCKSK